MPVVLNTDRLLLRPWTRSDVDAALPIFSRGPGTAWLPGGPSRATRDIVADAIQGWTSGNAVAESLAGQWALELRGEDWLVGACSLLFGEPGPESLKLRWLLEPSAWGHGYATEAASSLINWAMHQGGVHEVYAVVEPDNVRAKATAGRLGMDLVGATGHYGHLKLEVYRVRHGDLPYHQECGDVVADPGAWMELHPAVPRHDAGDIRSAP